jgi:hypothetical protein
MIWILNPGAIPGVRSVTMRTILTILTVLAVATPAFADDNVAGVYDVKFEESGSTCNPPPLTIAKGKLTIEVKKGTVFVNTDLIPQMAGTPQKNGRISAKTLKVVGTTIGGLSARYSVAGRVENGMLQLVMTAEYIRQDTNKPYCTQAWNVAGLRADTDKK